MVKWFCSSFLCINNFRTRDKNGSPIKFYRLPSKDKEIQNHYMKFFKTTGFNWKNGHVCAEHWCSGVRKDIQDLPDIVISEGVYKRLQQN